MSDPAGHAAPPSLCVVVVNWNGRDVLEDCLQSLATCEYPGLRVILVDNGSSDTSLAFVAKRFPGVEVMASPENLRWAGGNNLALARLRDEGWPQDQVLLLNNDTMVPQGSLERLTRAVAARPDAWAATPRILYFDDPSRVWYDGGRVGRWSGWVRHEGIRKPAGRRPVAERPVEYGTGCALLLTREGLQRCGLLDTDFYFYGEDAEYCLRVAASGGVVLHVPRSIVLHKVSMSLGVSSPRKLYLRSRSHVKLLARHWPLRRWPLLVPAQLAYFAGHAAWHLWHGRSASALALLEGVVDELRRAPLPAAVDSHARAVLP